MGTGKKAESRIQIATYWGDVPLDVMQVPERPGTVLAGAEKSCQVALPPDVMPHEDFPFLEIGPAATSVRAGQEVVFELESEQGHFSRISPSPDPENLGVVCAELPPKGRLRLGLKRLSLTLARKQVTPPRRMAPWQQLDVAFLNSLLIVLFAAAAFMATILLGPTALGSEDHRLHKNPTRFIRSLVTRIQNERKAIAIDMIKRDISTAKSVSELPSGQPGKAGKRGIPDRNRRASRKAIKPSDGQKLSRLGLVGALGDGPGLPGTFDTHHHGLDGDLEDAIGGLTGDRPGESGGWGGLDVIGTGPGGRGRNTGPIRHIGPLIDPARRRRPAPSVEYTTPEEQVPEITAGDPDIIGSLPPQVIRAYIRRHREQMRFCYTRALTRAPRLAGKLTVHFVIGQRGHVHDVSAEQTRSLERTSLRACVLKRVKGWKFPRPRGGGEVEVTYPFIFAPPSGE